MTAQQGHRSAIGGIPRIDEEYGQALAGKLEIALEETRTSWLTEHAPETSTESEEAGTVHAIPQTMGSSETRDRRQFHPAFLVEPAGQRDGIVYILRFLTRSGRDPSQETTHQQEQRDTGGQTQARLRPYHNDPTRHVMKASKFPPP